LNFVKDALAVSDTEVIATGSAGVASIAAHKNEVTIDNRLVTDKSLIYITPTSATGNQVLFLQRQVNGKSFTVGIENQSQNAIPFNWIIVN
jgi:deoxycytidylate deaminase